MVSALSRGSATILLVEDELAVRGVAKEMLEISGYDVLVAENGAKALEISAETEKSIDLLITDVIMPKMNGRELAGRARLLNPNL